MGKAIGQRTAHYDNPGRLQLEREDAQGEDRRPPQEKAEADGKDPREYDRGGFFPKRGQIGFFLNGRLHKCGCRAREDNFFAESFQSVPFDT